MRFLRGDKVNVLVVILGVGPAKMPSKLSQFFSLIQEPMRILRGTLCGAEGRFNEGLTLENEDGTTTLLWDTLRRPFPSALPSSDGVGDGRSPAVGFKAGQGCLDAASAPIGCRESPAICAHSFRY